MGGKVLNNIHKYGLITNQRINDNKEDIIVILKGENSDKQKLSGISKSILKYQRWEWKQKNHRLQSNMFDIKDDLFGLF